MKIRKINIKNYKLLRDVCVELNPDMNIFVGDNDAGKSTILEAISIVTSGKLHGYPFQNQLKANLFNQECREEYIKSLSDKPSDPPKIIIEAYCDGGDASYSGTNNESREDCVGIRAVIDLKPEYRDVYDDMVNHQDLKDIPVELYHVTFNYFSSESVYFRTSPLKTVYIDATRKDYKGMMDRFVSENIAGYLTDQQKTSLNTDYRSSRNKFNESSILKELNKSIQENRDLKERNVSLDVREPEVDEWQKEVCVSLNKIPFESIGLGTQNAIKIELAIKNSQDQVNTILMEEPENNLSYGNMAKLIHRIAESKDKQIFISTHSSFVANKLSLDKLLLVEKGTVKSFKKIPEDTVAYFRKLPGYDTLRVVLAEKVILVEGPTDDLIIQKAFLDKCGCLPLEKGIDIIAMNSLAFKRYCDIAIVLQKEISIVTDNDGDIQKNIEEKYKNYKDKPYLKFFYEQNAKLNTIEPSVLAVNCSNNGKPTLGFKKIIFNQESALTKNYEEVLDFMTHHKTEWAFRVFESTELINYPDYIKDVVNEYCETCCCRSRKNMEDLR